MDERSQAAVADFDRQVLGDAAGATVRQIEPPDVPTSSAEGVPDGYVEKVQEAAAEVGGDEQPAPDGSRVLVGSEPDAADELARAAELVVAADEVALAAEAYSDAMRNAFLRLPNRARPYEEHAKLLGALVTYHRMRASGS